MITVPIHEGEVPGRGQLSFDNPDVAFLYHSYNNYGV